MLRIIISKTAFLLLISMVFMSIAANGQYTSISIHQVNKKSAKQTIIQTTSPLSVSGSISLSKSDQRTYFLYIAIKRASENGWHIYNTFEKRSNQYNRNRNWEVKGLPLGANYDKAVEFHLFAFLADEDNPFDEGPLSQVLINERAVAQSRSISVIKDAQKGKSTKGKFTPSISVTSIDGEEVVASLKPYNVRLTGLISGTFIKPDQSYIGLVVQPLDVSFRWVMDDYPDPNGGNWGGIAYFGRVGMDEWDEFWVYAIITKRRLPKGKINLNTWDVYRKNSILAVSEKILVKRIELPVDEKFDIREVIISKVENKFPTGEVPILVGQTSQVEGYIKGRMLKSNENVFIFKRSAQDECGQLIGKAYHQNGRKWTLPLSKLGKPGEALKILSVVAEGSINSLCDPNIQSKKIMYFSKPVNILIKDEDKFLVSITRVGETQVRGKEAIIVPGMLSIEGNYKFEDASEDYEIWILRSDNNSWKLIGKATKQANLSWRLPPLFLTKFKESELIAVISKTKITSLSPEELSHVANFSKTVRIKASKTK